MGGRCQEMVGRRARELSLEQARVTFDPQGGEVEAVFS